MASKTEVDATLLSDQDLVAASAFGVTFTLDDATRTKYEEYGIPLGDAEGRPRPTLPVPAVFLVVDGTVRFQHADPDYRRRLDPDVLLGAAKAATPAAKAGAGVTR